MKDRINNSSYVRRNPDQVFTKIDEEVVFLSISIGEYVALNPMATQIWEHIDTPILVSKLINELLNEYEVGRDICEVQTIECLNELLAKEIVELNEPANV